MQKLTQEITRYLCYLNQELELSVSIHFRPEQISRFSGEVLRELLPYNTHKNPYCLSVKSQSSKEKICIHNQELVFRKCQRKTEFCGVCHAGVFEYIHAVRGKKGVVGFVSVSGFRKSQPPRRNIKRTLWEKSLACREIPRDLCQAVIPPLCRMLSVLVDMPMENAGSEYNLILQYINEHHATVSLTELCRHFCRSKSYISHMFKSTSGMTIRAYCNSVKLEVAKNLLENTDLPITDIAFDAGFNDVSYFIGLFKENFGTTPLKFKKSIRPA